MVAGVIKALEDERADRVAQLETLDSEWEGKQFSDDAKLRYNELNASINEFDVKIQLAKRELRRAEITKQAENGHGLKTPQVKRPGAVEDSLIYDVRTVQMDYLDPEATARQFRDRALRAIDRPGFPSDRLVAADAEGPPSKL